jgi:hypothetical protein
VSRALLLRGLRSAAIVIVVAALAIALFGSVEVTALAADAKFWTTLGAAGIGGFVGGLIQKKPKANNG